MPIVVSTLLGSLALAQCFDDLITSQDQIVKKHTPELQDFMLQANQNVSRHQLLAEEIIKNSKANGKKDPNLDWFNRLNLKEQQSSLVETELYIFVSLSMPHTRLIELLKEANHYNGVVVLRGLKNNSYKDTANFLQPIINKVGFGFIIDPTLFTEYNITKVPVFVLNNPLIKKHDQITGNIHLKYFLQEIARNGDLKEEAIKILRGKK